MKTIFFVFECTAGSRASEGLKESRLGPIDLVAKGLDKGSE